MSKVGGKNIALGCGLGCGGLIVLLILAGIVGQLVKSPATRDAELASQQVAVATFYKSMSDLRRSLPASDKLREQHVARACVPVATSFSGAPYAAIDEAWLEQFSDRGFAPAKPAPNPPPWYRDQDFLNIEAEAVPAEGMPKPDYEALLSNADELKRAPYLAVVLPLAQSWPVLSSDGKSFQGGRFRGWLILVDGKTKKPLGQTEFTAVSSTEIESLQISIHSQQVVGGDLKGKLENDFTDHFWQAVDTSVARVCGHERETNFASHETSFPPPGG